MDIYGSLKVMLVIYAVTRLWRPATPGERKGLALVRAYITGLGAYYCILMAIAELYLDLTLPAVPLLIYITIYEIIRGWREARDMVEDAKTKERVDQAVQKQLLDCCAAIKSIEESVGRMDRRGE
nr:MAG TPA: hypothetical protein [Caudoviricetes sp.]